ncbi:MAG: adenosylhomocysteinase [Bacillota bacterium]|nr:adenosylhomocysteinase [Bacillota bacterium]
MNDINSGRDKINWVGANMPILNSLREELRAQQPFKGATIVTSMHLEAKTAYLLLTLRELGAEVISSGSNPLSTQPDIAACLRDQGLTVNARHGCTMQEYTEDLLTSLSARPHLLIDDGGDLLQLLQDDAYRAYDERLIGGCEETTTGIIRLRQLIADKALRYPMISVNDADCKHLFDNRYGTGESVWTTITHLTNLSVASKTVVVAGYGWCGKGVAMRAKGLGARVIVTEVDPIKAMEALMDGFSVLPMREAAPLGDIFITVTGCKDVITGEHFPLLKDNAVLCNAGHFDCEVSTRELHELGEGVEIKPSIRQFTLNGKHINLLGEGRLVNLAAGMGHPTEFMDMSFALQLLSLLSLYTERELYAKPDLYAVPRHIDERVAAIKLRSLNVAIDELTEEQRRYLAK